MPKEEVEKKRILDACCGSRMFWFDKTNPNVLFADIRNVDHSLTDREKSRKCEIKPDIVMDFRDMPFEDGQFKMVVFDPPHLKKLGESSWMAKKYGKLTENWREDLAKGFSECWRVLEEGGTLIFKWSELDIKLSQVLELFPQQPLFGHTTRTRNTTIWVCFMKITNNS